MEIEDIEEHDEEFSEIIKIARELPIFDKESSNENEKRMQKYNSKLITWNIILSKHISKVVNSGNIDNISNIEDYEETLKALNGFYLDYSKTKEKDWLKLFYNEEHGEFDGADIQSSIFWEIIRLHYIVHQKKMNIPFYDDKTLAKKELINAKEKILINNMNMKRIESCFYIFLKHWNLVPFCHASVGYSDALFSRVGFFFSTPNGKDIFNMALFRHAIKYDGGEKFLPSLKYLKRCKSRYLEVLTKINCNTRLVNKSIDMTNNFDMTKIKTFTLKFKNWCMNNIMNINDELKEEINSYFLKGIIPMGDEYWYKVNYPVEAPTPSGIITKLHKGWWNPIKNNLKQTVLEMIQNDDTKFVFLKEFIILKMADMMVGDEFISKSTLKEEDLYKYDIISKLRLTHGPFFVRIMPRYTIHYKGHFIPLNKYSDIFETIGYWLYLVSNLKDKNPTIINIKKIIINLKEGSDRDILERTNNIIISKGDKSQDKNNTRKEMPNKNGTNEGRDDDYSCENNGIVTMTSKLSNCIVDEHRTIIF